jgi:hypothetical protein
MIPDHPIRPERTGDYVTSLIGMAIAAVMTFLPFRIKLRLLRFIRRHRSTAPIPEMVARCRKDVEWWAAHLWFGEFVCRHTAMSTYIVCGFRGAVPTLCFSARFSPVSEHMYLRVGEVHIGETLYPWPYKVLLEV